MNLGRNCKLNPEIVIDIKSLNSTEKFNLQRQLFQYGVRWLDGGCPNTKYTSNGIDYYIIRENRSMGYSAGFYVDENPYLRICTPQEALNLLKYRIFIE